MNCSEKIISIPTHIISGFLGSGKTSTIRSLLKTKPEDERWAVLINEFGEIGLDKNLLVGEGIQDDKVFIREVPGGCMCCTSGLPMTVALNKLLTQSKPHRLLIEPTGLGHPKEVLNALCSNNYRDVLDIQNTIALVDARMLRDSRYTNHNIFNEQIDVADIIVGNKSDLYQGKDKKNLQDYIFDRKGSKTKILLAIKGKIGLEALVGKSVPGLEQIARRHIHENVTAYNANDIAIPECGYIKAENSGEGFYCVGWRFSINTIFDYEAIFAWANKVEAERIKGVIITDQGVLTLNGSHGEFKSSISSMCDESRIEIITRNKDTSLESSLFSCLARSNSTE